MKEKIGIIFHHASYEHKEDMLILVILHMRGNASDWWTMWAHEEEQIGNTFTWKNLFQHSLKILGRCRTIITFPLM